ncbi:MAG: NADH-quinone oxidoreductase subunit NuoK [Proteobacteria bacterium]|nr:NADH-quinone oxidoreductase subunit NuoK [Pseudomonadota bacterium]
MVPIEHIMVFTGALFCLGVYGVMARRNAVLVLMAIELMLNAVAINLVAFGTLVYPGQINGMVFAIFVVTIAAAELGLGLAIVLRVYRMRSSINVDDIDLMRW